MRIWITTAWFPSLVNTSGIFVKEQAEALAAAGHEVTVILVRYGTLGAKLRGKWNPSEPLPSESLQYLRVNAITRIPLKLLPDPDKKLKTVILKRVEKDTSTYAKMHGAPDVVHHHCLSDNAFVAERIAAIFNVPYYFTEHSNYYTDEELNKFNSFETFEDRKRFVQHAAGRIAVSDVRARGYEKIYGAPFITISNVVAPIFYKELNKEKPNIFTFCCVAILDKRKRQDLLLKAFQRLLEKYNARLVLVGKGDKRNEYESLVEALGITDKVAFTGILDREGVVEQMDRSHCGVLSSDEETFGVVLAEAMFRGNPVISTRCGGPEEIITPKTGYIVEKDDVKALQDAMEKMIEYKDQFNPEEIRSYAEENFREEVIVAKLEACYES